MMLIAVISLVVPSAFSRFFSAEAIVREEQLLNLGMAFVLLIAYGLYLLFMLKTHPESFSAAGGQEEHHHAGAQWGIPRAVASLLVASVLAAWMSEILVGAAEGTGKALGMSQTFIGIVFLAIVGGAAESGSAIAMALKNKVDLTVGIALGSCIQIALFVAPVLVLLSYAVAPRPLELSFGRAELGCLFLAVLIGAMVSADGRSNWYKGVQLITVYVIMAFLFSAIPVPIPIIGIGAFVLYLISGLAETNRTPFDHVEADSELTGGFTTEYSGMQFSLFFLAEYANAIAIGLLASSLFLGGYHTGLGEAVDRLIWPLLPGVLVTKAAIIFLVFVWVRGTLPRFRYDQLMQFAWKRMLPATLALVSLSALAATLTPVMGKYLVLAPGVR
jgi:formate hydrogenlyase subunit 4